MSTKAQAILEEIKALSPEERREILESLRQPEDTVRSQRENLRQGRGLFAGSGLLEDLLAERAKERARE